MSDESPRTALTPPQPTKADRAITAVRVVASAVPVIGGPVVELLALIAPPLERRRQEFMESVAEAINRLEATQPGTIDGLPSNEEFASALAQALPAALRTQHIEKHDALRNAVLHAAVRSRVGNPEHATFIRYVDELEPYHLTLLEAFKRHSPMFAGMDSWVMVYKVLDQSLRGLFRDRDLFRSACQDLQTRYLVQVSSGVAEFPDVVDTALRASPEVAHQPRPYVRVTRVGDRFLKFIADPIGAPADARE